MKEKLSVDIKAALSLIRAENTIALKDLTTRIIRCFFKPVSGRGCKKGALAQKQNNNNTTLN
jgi:hypothetical protein